MAMPSASEAFFAQLPNDHLNPSEASLLKLLHDLGSAVESLLPRTVGLQEWAQRRVPDEHIEAVNKAGIVWIAPRDHVGRRTVSKPKAVQSPAAPPPPRPPPPPVPPAPPPPAPPPPVPSHRGGSTDTSRIIPDIAGRRMSAYEDTDFFDELPTDAFLPAEEVLRSNLIGALNKLNRRKQYTIERMMQCEGVAEAADELLPRGASMISQWIERRLGQEIEVSQDKNGDSCIKLLQTRYVNPEAYQAEVDEFIATLPPESFTDEEAALRDALVCFVMGWQGSGPPRLIDAESASLVKSARDGFLPSHIPLKTWMNARMGQEFELLQDAMGQYVIGLPGELDSEHIAATVTRTGKRKAKDFQFW
eukprot:gnl/TRDRNA2_/TRDRNA2_177880_c1_seq51.p1 gnl/TRDRNA2_/TRDRNA2_177880_c1~~gnl/TRDRNA2_/TRDRNA2_177880_c1_seq51.p1  ORF type:complete len:362 (-),score=61.14 gnl/TRDRNA2_/TRDRNA2_177880_c1_seq51:161-1246(-)